MPQLCFNPLNILDGPFGVIFREYLQVVKKIDDGLSFLSNYYN